MIDIESEDGEVYVITPFKATFDNIEFLWTNAGQYRFLFQDNHRGNLDLFSSYILSKNVLLMDVRYKDADEDVAPIGLMYADSIQIGHMARTHYLFWDKRQVGRHRVLLCGARWLMDEFELNRVNIEIPIIAFSALRRMQHMGVRLEGRRRNSFMFNENWVDLLQFGILREELTDENIEAARLPRTPDADNWFGLIDDDPRLHRAIFKKGAVNGRLQLTRAD